MYSYTIAGQPTKKRLQINETPPYPWTTQTRNLDAAYSYDNEGKMTSVNYPTTYSYVYPNLVTTAGPTYTYSYDSASRPIGLTDQNNYAAVSNVVYGGSTCAQSNQMASISYFGVTESRWYNNLGQLTSISIPGSINTTYTYPSGTNNGKIRSQYDAISGETVTYAYDSLNRLLSASGSGWSEAYGFDGFGNLVSKTPTGGAPQLSIGVNPANNQVVGHTYDNNGNDSYGGVSYDAENRINFVPGFQYAYDSQNKRIWKGSFSSGNLTAQEVYFYGVDGQKLGTYSLILNYGTGQPLYLADPNTNVSVYFAGKRVLMNGAAFVQDRLGSNTQGKYYPYGEDRGTPAPNDQVKFATYTRDSATGLDYADQRYYSNQFGRYMSPDRGPVAPSNPQSFNRYTYGLGDPIGNVDPDGRLPICSDLFIIYEGLGAASCGSEPLIYIGPDDPGEYLTRREQLAQHRVTAYDLILRSVAAAGIAAREMDPDLKPFPAFLRETEDCYIPNALVKGVNTRYIKYVLYGSDGKPFPASAGAVVTESLFAIYGTPGPQSQDKSGTGFEDTISTGNRGVFTALQQFQASVGGAFGVPGFSNVPLYVVDRLGRAFGSLVLNVNPIFTDINGDPNLDSGGVPHPCDFKP